MGHEYGQLSLITTQVHSSILCGDDTTFYAMITRTNGPTIFQLAVLSQLYLQANVGGYSCLDCTAAIHSVCVALSVLCESHLFVFSKDTKFLEYFSK